jgi:serine carboxypeptidase-like clade 1
MKLTSLFTLLPLSLSESTSDVVKGEDLPGWNAPLNSTWHSGFLPVGKSKQLHYMFIEAEQPLAPSEAPLVLWLNGGPGCSSLEGFLYEHGPLVVYDAHSPPNSNWDGNVPAPPKGGTLVRNPWSWSRAANMLYLEAPAGVGFSYSSNPADLNTGDNQTATDNLAALHAFFGKFPSFKTNPFYVSGESYGGVYVPTLSLKIYQDASFPGNMNGYLVGNGVFDFEDAAPTQVPFAYGHGMISSKLNKQLAATCAPDYLKPSAACQALLDKLEAMSIDTNGYDIYRTCYQPKHAEAAADVSSAGAAAVPLLASPSPSPQPSSVTGMLEMLRGAAADKNRAIDWLRGLRESVPCINSVAGTEWANLPAVKKALHVDESPNTWQVPDRTLPCILAPSPPATVQLTYPLHLRVRMLTL